MPTTTVSTIGTSGRDYSTLQAWEDACPANLVSADEIWEGQCYNDSEFTTEISIAGITTDATRYVHLTVATGQGFRDNPSAALRYNVANGAGLRVTGNYKIAINNGVSYTRVSNLQIYYDTNFGSGYYPTIKGLGRLSRCLVQDRRSAAVMLDGILTLDNNLCVLSGSTTSGYVVRGGNIYNCTLVRPADLSSGGGAFHNYVGTVQNCALFGFSSNGTAASITYSATDKGTMSGTGNLVSQVYADQFEDVDAATYDYKLKSGASLIGAGVTDATYGATDIVGTARPQGSAYDIGCWELPAGSTVPNITAVSAENITSTSADYRVTLDFA